MIKNLGELFLMLCLLVVGGEIIANAQIGTDVAIRGDVPFTFMVGDTTLPSGSYEIRTLDDFPGVLELRSVNGRTAVLVDTDNVEAKGDRTEKKSELVFNKVGDKYFLSDIWSTGSASGLEVRKSRMEKRLEDSGMRSEKHSITAIMRRLEHKKKSS